MNNRRNAQRRAASISVISLSIWACGSVTLALIATSCVQPTTSQTADDESTTGNSAGSDQGTSNSTGNNSTDSSQGGDSTTPGSGGGSSGGVGSTGGAGSGAGSGAGGGAGGGAGSGCIADRLTPPSDGHCQCTFVDCEATTLDCTCDLTCYAQDAQGGCLIAADSSGSGSSADDMLGGCNLSCTPEDDLSTEMNCSAADCIQTPNTTNIMPQTAPQAPPGTSTTMDRAPQNVGVLFVVDNSRSMQDDQMAAACAMDSFFKAAGANGATYSTGVVNTDMLGQGPGTSQTFESDGSYVGPPTLQSLNGSCTTTPVCACGTGQAPTGEVCNFDSSGQWLQSDAPGAQQQLTQLIVQGDQGSRNEGGMEQAFQMLAQMERDGTFATQAPKEIVVIADENSDADDFLCPFNAVDRHTQGIPNFNPPTPVNSDTSCQTDLSNFYKYYFTSRGIIVHGINYTADCVSQSSEEIGTIYLAVIQATGGHSESICHCERFDNFFTNVGKTTSDLSTSLCFDGVTPDPASIAVTYTEAGASTNVPQSATNGWAYDALLNCIVFAGTWAQQFGSFKVDYVDPAAPKPPPALSTACLPAGTNPLLDTLELLCGGAVVPASATNGWTFDSASGCFSLRGSYATVPGPCEVRYF